MNSPNATFLKEVRTGLSSAPKTLHPKWLYDARGSEIFEDITEVEEYYPTRTERAVFADALPNLKALAPDARTVVEYGSGSSRKTGALIEALGADTYVPIDISEAFLKAAAADLQRAYPDVRVVPVVADFTGVVPLPPDIGPGETRLGFFPGSTIGNFEPGTAVPFLARIRESLGEGSHFMITADLVKDGNILEAAYDDTAGVTAAFNLNLLTRMVRELGAKIDEDAFVHRSVWNADEERVEMHLEATRPTTIEIGAERYDFTAGETLHTENSYKYRIEGFTDMANRAGWEVAKVWTDARDWLSVFLLKG